MTDVELTSLRGNLSLGLKTGTQTTIRGIGNSFGRCFRAMGCQSEDPSIQGGEASTQRCFSAFLGKYCYPTDDADLEAERPLLSMRLKKSFLGKSVYMLGGIIGTNLVGAAVTSVYWAPGLIMWQVAPQESVQNIGEDLVWSAVYIAGPICTLFGFMNGAESWQRAID